MASLFKHENGTYYAKFKDFNGKWQQRSTGSKDKRTAEARLKEFERRAADPAYAAANETTLQAALTQMLKARIAKGCAEDTIKFYRSKGGHLVRVLGESTPLAKLNARLIDHYIEKRGEDGASNNTISKELTTLRGALKVAKRRGEFVGDIEAILPDGYSAQYKPKERFLTPQEAQALLAELTPDRAARVAFILATSARMGESDRAQVGDIDLEGGFVKVRGTKTEGSARVVPIVGVGHPLIEHALRYAKGENGQLFRPWGNIRRDLHEACARAGIEKVSPNDLRRTTATWMVMGGVPLHLVSKVLGHKDTRMVERVYGQLPPEALRQALSLQLEGDEGSTKYSPNFGESGGLGGQDEQPSEARQIKETPENSRFRGFDKVPRDRIELPTRGFSIPVSLFELLALGLANTLDVPPSLVGHASAF